MTYQVTPPAAAAGTSETAAPSAPPPEETKISVSRGLAAWLTQNQTSFAITSYQSGRLFLVGTMPDGTVSVHQSAFSRAMGVCWDRNGLWLASRVQIWRLENILPEGMVAQGTYDLSLMPRQTFITGDIDVHEMGVGDDGQPVFVNTSYSCLATIDPVHSFRPIWKPSFISELAREDRCHMNGLGMLDGKPKYVTAVSQTDVADGWHGRPLPKGVVIDVETNRVVTDQLSMPHSPREGAGREAVRCRQRSWIPRRGRQGDRRPSGCSVLPRVPSRARHHQRLCARDRFEAPLRQVRRHADRR